MPAVLPDMRQVIKTAAVRCVMSASSCDRVSVKLLDFLKNFASLQLYSGLGQC